MKSRYLSLFYLLSLDIIFSEVSLLIISAYNENFRGLDFPYIIWPFIVLASFYFFKIYNILWEYANIPETLHIIPEKIS